MPDAQELFKRHINKVLFRENTISKRSYSKDATILAWELANEPQSDMQLLKWAGDISKWIKQQAQDQLVTTGSEAKFGEGDFKALHNLPDIDFACAHVRIDIMICFNLFPNPRTALGPKLGSVPDARQVVKQPRQRYRVCAAIYYGCWQMEC